MKKEKNGLKLVDHDGDVAIGRPTMRMVQATYKEIKIKLLRSDYESFQDFSEEVFVAYLQGNLAIKGEDGEFNIVE